MKHNLAFFFLPPLLLKERRAGEERSTEQIPKLSTALLDVRFLFG
jgi:hypothetical protein